MRPHRLDELRVEKLGLPLLPAQNQSRLATAFTLSIEAREGVTTGISAADRAHTISVAINHNRNKKDIVSPGHVFPIVAKDGGVLIRAGHTEASVDISKLANKNPSAVICEIMNEDGSMAKRDDLINFARRHKLSIGKIEDLIAYRLKKENFIKLKKSSDIILGDQKFKIKIFENIIDGSEHFALIKGKLNRNIIPRVRVISSNIVQNYLLGNKIPNSFNQTVAYFKKFKSCILVFIKDPNLKSVSATLKDYQNKKYYKKGKDKLIRNYGLGAQILKNLQVKKMILVTKSRKKVIGLEGYNLSITKQEII